MAGGFIRRRVVTGNSRILRNQVASRLAGKPSLELDPKTLASILRQAQIEKSKGVKPIQYAIIIERDPDSNYSAYVPDLPGCVGAAETLDEIKQLMRETIEFHIAGMREDGLPIPGPSTEVAVVEVAA